MIGSSKEQSKINIMNRKNRIIHYSFNVKIVTMLPILDTSIEMKMMLYNYHNNYGLAIEK